MLKGRNMKFRLYERIVVFVFALASLIHGYGFHGINQLNSERHLAA